MQWKGASELLQDGLMYAKKQQKRLRTRGYLAAHLGTCTGLLFHTSNATPHHGDWLELRHAGIIKVIINQLQEIRIIGVVVDFGGILPEC